MHNGLPADASRPGLLKYIESGKCGPIFCSTPLKMWRVTQKTRRLFIFPSISHFEGIGQGGISREIPPGKYRPGISRTTLSIAMYSLTFFIPSTHRIYMRI